MKRKDFIRNTAIAAVTMPSLIGSSFKTDKKKGEEAMAEFSFDFELDEITISELQENFKKGTYTSEAVTALYIQRIGEIDKDGPNLNSVIELNPDALSVAKEMDAERNSGKIRGPLHGIPILIKDNIDTADKMMTTAGSLALEGNIASNDAFIVEKLRDAGAVLLGKTNLSEWANFRSSKSCSGWSSRGGQTNNPYVLDHNPCGSSSGSGVAVSANLCAAAVGTETDGSVTCPASVCGLVGIKPTVGLVSRTGIIPISFTQDTAGPLARTVTDAAILLAAMSGPDPYDEKTNEIKGKYITDYSEFLNINGLKGKRIGIEKKKYENQFMGRLFQKALETMKLQGAVVIELEYLDKLNALGEAEFDVLKYEFKYGLDKYLSASNAKVRNLKEVIDFNAENQDKVMPTFKQEIFIESNELEGLESAAYKEALEKSHAGSKTIIDETMKNNDLDALCGLTMGPACSTDIIYGDRWGDVFLTAPAAMSGYPHITVPAGKVFGLPVGLSFFSGAFKEGELIAMGYSFEQAVKHRVKPDFKSSIELQ
ncbi:MAG TPA: amidase [Ignavibacteria bacterium]|nr:amidase [Ignavibacteria bacterium]